MALNLIESGPRKSGPEKTKKQNTLLNGDGLGKILIKRVLRVRGITGRTKLRYVKDSNSRKRKTARSVPPSA